MGKIKELSINQYNKLVQSVREIDKTVFYSNDSYVLNLVLRKSRANKIENRIRRYLQTVLSKGKRIEITALKTGIGVTRKTFKNKTVIEVSNPQTNPRFYKRLGVFAE